MTKNQARASRTDPDAPLQLAAPAPITPEDDDSPPQEERDRDLDALCERWVAWTRSRRLFAQPPQLHGTLGRLQRRAGGGVAGGPDAACSAELAAFHLAYTCQPFGVDKQVFELHYLHRVKPVKVAADALGISRSTWYSTLSDIRKRIANAAVAVEKEAADELAAMVAKRT